jgi:hypothetical protein
MDRAALLMLLVAVLACSSSGSRGGGAKPADPAPVAREAAQPAAPCDFKVKALSDPGQKQIQCSNGESFVVRLGTDGQWHEEMKVRAGTRPGYASPEEAARARCCGAGGEGS